VTETSEIQKDVNRFIRQLSGAKVLLINGQDPFVAVNANALIAGSFQALGTRQNGWVFSPIDNDVRIIQHTSDSSRVI